MQFNFIRVFLTHKKIDCVI